MDSRNAHHPLRIGLAGLGTVGAGVFQLLHDNADLIAARAGRPLHIVAVNARDPNRARDIDLRQCLWAARAQDLLTIENLDVIVEVIGGADGDAHALAEGALKRGIHFVTANKALIAYHGAELAKLAEAHNAGLGFEAAVAGCVPVVRALRDGLAASHITALHGILNGTCNYILTQMRETGQSFAESLKQAQAKGYAEADPALDIEGTDTAHKIAILAALAFGTAPVLAKGNTTGIAHITPTDIQFSGELGYRIKLLGLARDVKGKILQSVEPCLVPAASPLGMVEDVYNALFITGNYVETPFLSGRGAGREPTAAAVVSDLIDLARGRIGPAFGIPAAQLRAPVLADTGDDVCGFYLRLNVIDKPGVIADLSAILRDRMISIEALLQRGRDPGQPVPIVMKTHACPARDMRDVVARMAKLEACAETPCLLRIEEDL